MLKRNLLATAAVALAMLNCALPAYAQAGGAEVDDAAGEVGPQEIIVTAQKREQRLQDVPMAITALSSQALQDAGVLDIKDLTVLTPGLTIRNSVDSSLANARIRGVGTAGEDDGLESSVGVVIDGVYRPRIGVGIGDLGEISQIEVLKGPQGTLFGRNNTAGVINITTEAPSFDFGAKASFTVGNYDAIGGTASLTGPIVEDKLAARLFFARRKRDGFIDVRTGEGPRTSTEDQTQDYYSIRGQLLFTPTSNLSARLIADYSDRDENCCALLNWTNNETLHLFNQLGVFPIDGTLYPADPSARTASANRDITQRLKDRGVSLQVDWDTPWLGGAKLTSITALRKWTGQFQNEYYDWTAIDLNYGRTEREYRTFTQELRLAGSTDAVDWLVGGYYSKEQINRRETISFGTDYSAFISTFFQAATGAPATVFTGGVPITAGVTNDDEFEQNDRTFALFTHNSFHLTDKLDLTVGLRYTSGKRTLDGTYRSGPGSAGCGGALAQYDSGTNPAWEGAKAAGAAGDLLNLLCVAFWDPSFAALGSTHQARREKEWSGTVNLAYHFNDDLMGYLAYSRGYKGGGFNFQRVRTAPGGSTATSAGVQGVPNADTSFAPEFTDNYEVGLRSQWFDRALTLNVTAYREVFTNFQRNDFRGTAWFTFAVPEVVTKGVDLDWAWKTPWDLLDLRGGFSYADVRTSATDNPPPLLDPIIFGRRLSQSPRYSGSIGANLRIPLSEKFMARVSTDLLWTDAYPWRINGKQPDTIADETRINARIAFGPQDERWALEFWGQNLLNESRFIGHAEFPLTDPIGENVIGVLSPPRTYGATLRVSF